MLKHRLCMFSLVSFSGGRAIKPKKSALERRSDRRPVLSPPHQPVSDPDFEITWVCPNCGQQFFGKNPPDLCDYCQDFTTWRRVPNDRL